MNCVLLLKWISFFSPKKHQNIKSTGKMKKKQQECIPVVCIPSAC